MFTCSFEALSEKKICGFVPKIREKQILNELKERNVMLHIPISKFKQCVNVTLGNSSKVNMIMSFFPDACLLFI